jgi:hypothetical protein
MKMMQTIGCDSAGCKRHAEWVWAAELATPQRNFLCQECWERLCETHPNEAGGYMPYQIHTNSVRRFSFLKEN